MNDIQNTLDTIVKDDWRRPDLYDGREVPRQKDLIDLTKPDGVTPTQYRNNQNQSLQRHGQKCLDSRV